MAKTANKGKVKFEDHNHHGLHATVLAVIFGLALFGFWRFKGLEILQLYVVTVAVLAYVGWGSLFHYYHKRLSWQLISEYLLIGALVLLTVFWLLAFT